MNILIPSASFMFTDNFSFGEGIYSYLLLKHLTKFGYNFYVISSDFRLNKKEERMTFIRNCSFLRNNLIKAGGCRHGRKLLSTALFNIGSCLISKRIMKKNKIDLVHHIAPAASNYDFDILPIMNRMDAPFIFGPIFQAPPKRQVLLLTSKIYKETLRKCDVIVTGTNYLKKIYSKIFTHANVVRIPLGVDTKFFKVEKSQRNRKYSEILSVGALRKYKGLHYLIQAMPEILKEHKNTILRIIGSGPELKNLSRLSRKLKVDSKVIFQGFVAHTDIPKFFKECDIYCHAAPWEAFGVVMIEAMASGKPVVASDWGGQVDIVDDGETGYLVKPRNPAALADAVIKLLDDGESLERMGRKGREKAEREFSWSSIAKKYRALYSQLAS